MPWAISATWTTTPSATSDANTRRSSWGLLPDGRAAGVPFARREDSCAGEQDERPRERGRAGICRCSERCEEDPRPQRFEGDHEDDESECQRSRHVPGRKSASVAQRGRDRDSGGDASGCHWHESVPGSHRADVVEPEHGCGAYGERQKDDLKSPRHAGTATGRGGILDLRGMFIEGVRRCGAAHAETEQGQGDDQAAVSRGGGDREQSEAVMQPPSKTGQGAARSTAFPRVALTAAATTVSWSRRPRFRCSNCRGRRGSP